MHNVGHSTNACAVAFSPDGKLLATGSNSGDVILWKLELSKVLRRVKLNNGSISKLMFSKSGDQLIVAASGNVFILETKSGELLNKFELPGYISSVNFSKSKDKIVCLSDSVVSVINLVNKKIEKNYTVKYESLNAVLSPDGKFLVVGIDSSLSIYDAITGKYLLKIKIPNATNPKVVFFIEDGKSLLVAGYPYYYDKGSIHIIDFLTGKPKKSFKDNPAVVKAKISEDDRYLLTANTSQGAMLFDISTMSLVKEFYGGDDLDVTISPDNKNIALVFGSYHEPFIKVYDLNTESASSLGSDNNRFYASVFANDDMNLKIAAQSGNLNTLDKNIPKGISLNKIADFWSEQIAISSDNKYMAVAGNGNINLLDAKSLNLIKKLPLKQSSICDIAFGNDSKHLIFSTWNDFLYKYDLDRNIVSDSIFAGRKICLTPDKQKIIVANSNNEVLFIDIQTFNIIKSLKVQTGDDISSITCSNDNKTIFFSLGFDFKIIAINSETGKIIWEKPFDYVWDLKISQDNKYLMSANDNGTLILLNPHTGEEIKSFDDHSFRAYSIAQSNDGRYFATCGWDGVMNYYDAATYKKLFMFYQSSDSSKWIVVSPDGRFDGSESGFDLLHYSSGMDIIPLKSNFENYYTPNLIQILLSSDTLTKPVVKPIIVSLPPVVKITSPMDGDTLNLQDIQISVNVIDMGGGIDEVRLYQNGKLLDGTTRGFKSTGQNHEFTISLVDGENRIKATAFNSQRTEAIPDEIVVHYKAPQQVKPNMHILAIGINSYLNPKYSLNYAKNDADAFAQTLKAGASSIFGNVNLTVFNDADATKAGILAAIEKIKSASKAEDVFVFYYAGHGVMSSGSETEKPLFYLVPHDVTKMYEADEMLKKLGISATEIGEFSKNIKAQKQLFVIDACQSGGAVQTLAMRGAAEEKAIAQLARSTGTYFIAASGTEQFATEVAELGHGIFTYSVIEALNGSCKSSDGRVTVNLLKSCVEDLVPELSKKHKGQPQFPTGYGFGMDFPIVIVK